MGDATEHDLYVSWRNNHKFTLIIIKYIYGSTASEIMIIFQQPGPGGWIKCVFVVMIRDK